MPTCGGKRSKKRSSPVLEAEKVTERRADEQKKMSSPVLKGKNVTERRNFQNYPPKKEKFQAVPDTWDFLESHFVTFEKCEWSHCRPSFQLTLRYHFISG